MSDLGKRTFAKMVDRPDGKPTLGASADPPNELEKAVLKGLDVDKLNDLGESLFTLNNRRYGPIAGAYMVICTKPEKEWCVAQLNADRAKPFILFEDKVFSSLELAQAEAELFKQERGEIVPPGRNT
jgi:hypothetical protein